MAITFGILTVSDSSFMGTRNDTSGPKLEIAVKTSFPDAIICNSAIVPDEISKIEEILLQWTFKNCNVILTTGGTGFSPRDVTPEATKAVIQREAPGLTHAMMRGSLDITPMGMLSRGVCGIRDKTIIINLPGSVKGAIECFGFVKHGLKHAVDLLKEDDANVKRLHDKCCVIPPSDVKLRGAAFRLRKSPYPMIESERAQTIIEEIAKIQFSEEFELIDISESLYRVLSENIKSKDPLPPFPASIKDGYAVISTDGLGERRVRDAIIAGDNPFSEILQSGEIIRISTGAPIPSGADAVVQVEDTDLVFEVLGKELVVKINVVPEKGQDIRAIGSDIPVDTVLLQKNDVITAAHIGLLASAGVTKVPVYRRFSIALISTGNELQDPHAPLQPGHIRDSNKLALINLFQQYHYKAVDCGTARDEPDDVKRSLFRALLDHDIVVTTGGVSMGEYDVVKSVLIKDFKAEIHFGRINMKPGKPTTFASCIFQNKPKLIFGLPGNPVSAMVTSILYVIPLLQSREKFPKAAELSVILDEALKLDLRPEYMRATAYKSSDGKLMVKTTGNQISSRLPSFVGAQVLLALPGKTGTRPILEKGTSVQAILIDPFLSP